MDGEELFNEIRRTVSLETVSFGYRTVTLFRTGELREAQIGYSISESGEDLTGTDEGDWRGSWLIVASEDELGNPIFIDLKAQGLPVLTAAHGKGEWNPELIASSFQGFIAALEEVERVSQSRRNPVELEQNPLPAADLDRVLKRIAEANGNVSLEFWESWLEL